LVIIIVIDGTMAMISMIVIAIAITYTDWFSGFVQVHSPVTY
jgi:hypothetical protein